MENETNKEERVNIPLTDSEMRANIFEKYQYKNHVISIWQDDNSDSPREWDNIGHMITCHRRYLLGEETFNVEDYKDWDDVSEHLKTNKGAIIILPLYLYDHSGISIKIGSFQGLAQHAEFDSGMVGFIYATENDLKINNISKDDIQKALENEVETYNDYLEGNVYGYTIEKQYDTKVTKERNGKVISSEMIIELEHISSVGGNYVTNINELKELAELEIVEDENEPDSQTMEENTK